MPEYHEVIGAGDLYEINTQKNSDYDTAMYLDVSNIDKNYTNTQRTRYKAVNELNFEWVKLFPRSFINICKNHPNDP